MWPLLIAMHIILYRTKFGGAAIPNSERKYCKTLLGRKLIYFYLGEDYSYSDSVTWIQQKTIAAPFQHCPIAIATYVSLYTYAGTSTWLLI